MANTEKTDARVIGIGLGPFCWASGTLSAMEESSELYFNWNARELNIQQDSVNGSEAVNSK